MLETWKGSYWLDEVSHLLLWNMKEIDPSLRAIIFTPTWAVMTQASDSVRFRQTDTLAQDFEFWITQRKQDSPNLFSVTVVVTVFIAEPQLPNLMSVVLLSFDPIELLIALLLVILPNFSYSFSRIVGALNILLTRFLFAQDYYKRSLAIKGNLTDNTSQAGKILQKF